jgi:hypothetical protein
MYSRIGVGFLNMLMKCEANFVEGLQKTMRPHMKSEMFFF